MEPGSGKRPRYVGKHGPLEVADWAIERAWAYCYRRRFNGPSRTHYDACWQQWDGMIAARPDWEAY